MLLMPLLPLLLRRGGIGKVLRVILAIYPRTHRRQAATGARRVYRFTTGESGGVVAELRGEAGWRVVFVCL